MGGQYGYIPQQVDPVEQAALEMVQECYKLQRSSEYYCPDACNQCFCEEISLRNACALKDPANSDCYDSAIKPAYFDSVYEDNTEGQDSNDEKLDCLYKSQNGVVDFHQVTLGQNYYFDSYAG